MRDRNTNVGADPRAGRNTPHEVSVRKLDTVELLTVNTAPERKQIEFTGS